MGEWKQCDRFLGMTIEYHLNTSGDFSRGNNVACLRGTEKIVEMIEKFGYLVEIYNPRGKKRVVPLPLNCIQKVEDLSQDKSEALDDEGKKIYMSLVGKIGYVATSLRFDARFAYLVLARRLSSPRQWDMYLAVWVMEYLVGTKEMPLVLGGPSVELETLTDASFGILEERRSVKGHLLRTNNMSGAISVNAAAIKNTVTSVWEAEVNAASDGVDTLLYARNLCQELRYPMGSNNRVLIDNESAIHWIRVKVYQHLPNMWRQGCSE
jgi:hypothetical protein